MPTFNAANGIDGPDTFRHSMPSGSNSQNQKRSTYRAFAMHDHRKVKGRVSTEMTISDAQADLLLRTPQAKTHQSAVAGTPAAEELSSQVLSKTNSTQSRLATSAPCRSSAETSRISWKIWRQQGRRNSSSVSETSARKRTCSRGWT